MTRISLVVCLMLLVALSSVYETQGTFSLPLYLKNFPKRSTDFVAFAYKGMSDFMDDLEGMCPKSSEFKGFFAILKDYMACFDSTSSNDIQVEMSQKSEKLFRAMSLLDNTKGGIAEESWKLVDAMLSMGKHLVEMKKSSSKEITFDQRKELIGSMVKWTRAVGLFVKTASENRGHNSIDLSTFGIDYDTGVSSPSSKRVIYETQKTFSLPLYLKNFPKMGKDVESFAYKGMSEFLSSLESKCPSTAEFMNFFAILEDYMACFKSASAESKDFHVEMTGKSKKLFRAVSLLDGTKGGTSADSWRMVDGSLSMGKVLVEMKKHGSMEITFDQRKELIGSMVKWTRAVGLFVNTAAEKKGKSIDLSAFGIDYEDARGVNGKGSIAGSTEL